MSEVSVTGFFSVVPKAGATTPKEATRLLIENNLDEPISHVKYLDATERSENFEPQGPTDLIVQRW